MSNEPNSIPSAEALDRIYNHPTSNPDKPAAPAKSAADRIYDHPTSTPEAEKALQAKAPQPQAKPKAAAKPAPAAPEKPQAVEKAADPADEDADDEHDDDAGDGDSDPLEGLDLDESYAVSEDLREVASDLGLDTEGVGKLVEVELKHRSEYWDRQTDTWLAELNKEPDQRGLVRHANNVIKKYGDPGFAESLGPYGNHAGLIRLLGRVGREMEKRNNG